MSARVTESTPPRWSETDRLAALRGFGILDTAPEAAFDDIARSAASICNAPIALVSLMDKDRQWFKCEIGLGGVRETSREVAFCAHAILQSELFVVPDTAKDPRFHNNPLVTGDLGLRFYAGAPLVTDEGLPLGTLCIFDRQPRPEGLSREQAEALLALSRAVVAQLKLRNAYRALDEHGRKLR